MVDRPDRIDVESVVLIDDGGEWTKFRAYKPPSAFLLCVDDVLDDDGTLYRVVARRVTVNDYDQITNVRIELREGEAKASVVRHRTCRTSNIIGDSERWCSLKKGHEGAHQFTLLA